MAFFRILVFRFHPAPEPIQQPLVNDLLVDEEGPQNDKKAVVVLAIQVKGATAGVDDCQVRLLAGAGPADVDDFE